MSDYLRHWNVADTVGAFTFGVVLVGGLLLLLALWREAKRDR